MRVSKRLQACSALPSTACHFLWHASPSQPRLWNWAFVHLQPAGLAWRTPLLQVIQGLGGGGGGACSASPPSSSVTSTTMVVVTVVVVVAFLRTVLLNPTQGKGPAPRRADGKMVTNSLLKDGHGKEQRSSLLWASSQTLTSP